MGVCSDSQAKKFVAALTLPFNKNAIGAQVPDSWSFPTETRFIKADFKLYADAAGNLDFTLMPSLFQSILTSTPDSVSGSVPNVNVNINAIGIDPQFQISGFSGPPSGASDGNWNLGGVAVAPLLAAQLNQYRIVGWGARVRALIAPINQSGRLIFSSTPSNEMALFEPNVGLVVGGTTYTDVANFFKLPTPGPDNYLTTEMLNVPDAMECMFSDLSLSGGMQWVSKCTSPDSLRFRSVDNSLVQGSTSLGYGLTDGLGTGSATAITVPADVYLYEGAPNTAFGPEAFTSSLSATTPFSYFCSPNAGSSASLFNVQLGPFESVTGLINAWIHTGGPIPSAGWWGYIIPQTLTAGTDVYNQILAGLPVSSLVQCSTVVFSNFTVTGSSGPVVATCAQLGFTAPLLLANGQVICMFPGFLDPSGRVFPKGVWEMTNVQAIPQTGITEGMGEIPFPHANLLTSSTLSGSTIVDPDFVTTKGWSQMSCRGYGLNQGGSTVTAPVLSVEVVYHIEGPPLISGAAGSLLSGGQYPFVDRSLLDEALDYAAKKPHFQLIAGGRSGSTLTNMALN